MEEDSKCVICGESITFDDYDLLSCNKTECKEAIDTVLPLDARGGGGGGRSGGGRRSGGGGGGRRSGGSIGRSGGGSGGVPRMTRGSDTRTTRGPVTTGRERSGSITRNKGGNNNNNITTRNRSRVLSGGGRTGVQTSRIRDRQGYSRYGVRGGGGYGRNGYHGRYSRSFWGLGSSLFYPFGFGAFWFRQYRWLPYYYGRYAYGYYPNYWTPLYIPSDRYYDYDYDRASINPNIIINNNNYVMNPDIGPNVELPLDNLPPLNVDIGEFRLIGMNKRQEDITPDEEIRIQRVFDTIKIQYNQLVRNLSMSGEYQRWTDPSRTQRGEYVFRIVPDLDRAKFIWVRDDTVNKNTNFLQGFLSGVINYNGHDDSEEDDGGHVYKETIHHITEQDIVIDHYSISKVKYSDDSIKIHEEGTFLTTEGDVYEYELQDISKATLTDKITNAVKLSINADQDEVKRLKVLLNEVLFTSETKIVEKKEEGDDDDKDEEEYIVGYSDFDLSIIIYGDNGKFIYTQSNNKTIDSIMKIYNNIVA